MSDTSLTGLTGWHACCHPCAAYQRGGRSRAPRPWRPLGRAGAGLDGTAAQVRTVVASLDAALAFTRALAGALPLLTQLLARRALLLRHACAHACACRPSPSPCAQLERNKALLAGLWMKVTRPMYQSLELTQEESPRYISFSLPLL